MRFLALGLLLMIAVEQGHAETVRVLSGEHPGFTRLVFQFEKPTRWRFGRTGAGYELRIGRDDVAFDLGGVFARIPRDRLAGLSRLPGGRLGLDVAPGNRAVPYDLSEAVLVIDIRTGPPAPDSPHEMALPVEGAPGDAPEVAATPHRPATIAPPAPDLAWLGLERALTPPARATPKPVAGGRQPQGGDVFSIAAAQDLIVKQIARAAAQNLLTPVGPTQPEPFGQTPVADVPEPRPTTAPAAESVTGVATPESPAPLHEQMNVTAQTSIDRDSFDIVRRALSGPGDPCPKGILVDVAAWGGDFEPAALIATRRAAVLEEFDRANAAAVQDLVRAYLYLGFGAEAAATLGAFHVSVSEADLLLSLAAIMDGDVPPAASRLRAMAGCDGPGALWALLAQASGTPLPDLDVDAVRLSFSALPLHLRRHLGSAVAGRLMEIGLSDAATAVQNAITRAPGDPGAGARIISARLDQMSGRLPESEDALLEVILGDGPDAAKALVLYVDGRLEQGLPIQQEIAVQAGALAFEHRNAGDGPALKRAEILAHAASGAYGAAFSAWRRWQSRSGADRDGLSIVGPLFGLLARDAPDQVFLREVFALGPGTAGMPALPLDAALSVSERLLGLGFADEARAVLAGSGQVNAQTRMFLARVALARADGVGALRAIAGMTGGEAARLRGLALAQMGNHAAAETVFSTAGDLRDAARAAWAAGDWQRYATLAGDERAAILDRLGVLSPPSDETAPPGRGADPAAADAARGGAEVADGVLARNRALLEQSRASRQALSELRATLGANPARDN
jgi:hypothetical protein